MFRTATSVTKITRRGRRKKGEEEEGKEEREGRNRGLRGRGRGRKEPKVPFSPTLLMDASLKGLHESEAELYPRCLPATVASLLSHPYA